jgi:hypothetical protein
MRAGIAVSILGHLGLLMWVFLLFATPRPFASLPTEPITVDLVSAPELGEQGPKRGDGAPQPAGSPENAQQSQKPDSVSPAPPQREARSDTNPTSGGAETATKTAPERQSGDQERKASSPSDRARPAARPEKAAPAPPSSEPAAPQSVAEPAKPASNLVVYGAAVASVAEVPLLSSAGAGGILEPPADTPAGLTPSEAAALKQHLQKCWSFAGGDAGDSQKLKAVVRLALRPNGALAAAPVLLEASASAGGPKLVQAAITAVQRCEPYSFLPATKYREWRVLDLHFSPQGLAGG